MIGEKIVCLKNVGLTQLNDANFTCQSLNASQILPRSKQEFDDLVPALLSLDLDSKDRNTVVSIGMYKANDGGWRTFANQSVTYFNWLPNEPDLVGNQNYSGLWIERASGTAGWADHSGSDELNVVCMKGRSQGENKGL